MLGLRMLPSRAEEVLNFIKDYKTQRGIAPTYREIGRACGMTSTAVVKYWLDWLERNDFIERYPGVPRGIVLNESLAESA